MKLGTRELNQPINPAMSFAWGYPVAVPRQDSMSPARANAVLSCLGTATYVYTCIAVSL